MLDRQDSFTRGLRTLITTSLVIVYSSTIGCAGVSSLRLTSEQLDSLTKIESIALVTPDVTVVRQGITMGPTAYERPVLEWTQSARHNIVEAAAKEFGKLFVIRPNDSKQLVDAHLVITASDEIKTSGRRGMDTLGFAYGTFLMPLLYVTIVPAVLIANPEADVGKLNRNLLKGMWPAGLTRFKVDLTDRQSRNTLWSFTKESRSGYDLRDPGSVESLMAEAAQDLARARSQKNDCHCRQGTSCK